MPRPRFDKLPADKRQRILEIAATEFASRGFEHASLNRIISAAGISKGAAYYYFDDKADLFATVIGYGWELLVPETDLDLAQLNADSFWPVLLEAYGEMLRKTHEQPWVTTIGKLIYGPPPSKALGEVVARQFARAHQWIGDVILRGQALGVVRSDVPGPLLLAMVASAGEAADRWIIEHADTLPPEQLGSVALSIFDMLKRLVAPAPGVARP